MTHLLRVGRKVAFFTEKGENACDASCDNMGGEGQIFFAENTRISKSQKHCQQGESRTDEVTVQER